MTGVTAIGVTGGTVTAAAADSDKRRSLRLPRPPFNLNLKFLRVRRLYTSMILVTVKVSLALASSD